MTKRCLALYTKLNKEIRRFLLISATTLVILVMATQGALAASYGCGGSVGGVTWSGNSYVSYSAQNGGWVYPGQSITQAASAIDEVWVHSIGSESCGFYWHQTEWDAVNDLSNTWIVGQGGTGWAMVGECSWSGLPTSVETHGYHEAREGLDHQQGESEALLNLPS